MLTTMPSRTTGRSALFALLCLSAAGCETFGPEQLWKLNRQPNMDGGDAYFSVPAEFDRDAAGDDVTILDAPARKI